MKRSTMQILTTVFLISAFVLTGCAEKDHMGMETMDKTPMESGMKKDTKMMEPMQNEMKQEMDTMSDGMEKTMEDDMKKME